MTIFGQFNLSNEHVAADILLTCASTEVGTSVTIIALFHLSIMVRLEIPLAILEKVFVAADVMLAEFCTISASLPNLLSCGCILGPLTGVIEVTITLFACQPVHDAVATFGQCTITVTDNRRTAHYAGVTLLVAVYLAVAAKLNNATIQAVRKSCFNPFLFNLGKIEDG